MNSDFVSGLEIGVTESGLTVCEVSEVCVSIRKGKIYKGSTPVSRQKSRLRNLKRGDRLGLVWRVKSSDLGSVHLYLNGEEILDIATCGPVYPFWILSGSVEAVLLLPEHKRSRLWAPEKKSNNPR